MQTTYEQYIEQHKFKHCLLNTKSKVFHQNIYTVLHGIIYVCSIFHWKKDKNSELQSSKETNHSEMFDFLRYVTVHKYAWHYSEAWTFANDGKK